jgi:hypothetical protein
MQTNGNDNRDQIRQRAYALWDEHGRPEGHETAFWLQAERELKSEHTGGLTGRNDKTLRSGSGSDGPR